MKITEILRRIWLFSANKKKRSESDSKQPTQPIVELNPSLRHIIVTRITCFATCTDNNWTHLFTVHFQLSWPLYSKKKEYDILQIFAYLAPRYLPREKKWVCFQNPFHKFNCDPHLESRDKGTDFRLGRPMDNSKALLMVTKYLKSPR